MTEKCTLTQKQTNSSPFKDMVNQFMQNVQEEVCKKVANSQASKIKETKRCLNQNQNQANVQFIRIDKTIKQAAKLTQQNLTLASTIHRDMIIKSEQSDYTPQWDILANSVSGQISHILRLQCQFSEASKLFIQFSQKQKLMMSQQTESFVTVKKGDSIGCKCFLKAWSKSESYSKVYQLRRYRRGNQRCKLILVEGDQRTFHNFFLSFLRVLQKSRLVKLLTGQRVQLLFDQENKEIIQIAKRSHIIIQRLAKQKTIKSQDIQALAKDTKEENQRLKQLSKKMPEIKDIPALQKQMQDLCIKNSGVMQLFEMLHHKDYQLYRAKRQKILGKFNIRQLFKQLQIEQHFEQFQRQRSFKQLEIAQQRMPYMLAILQLKRFAASSSNSVSLQSAVLFHQKIRQSYSNYFKNSFKMGDMDDFLPITIFCVLEVDCQTNMLGKVKMLLSQFQAMDEAEWEKKTLTDIQAAFEYILMQWKLVQ